MEENKVKRYVSSADRCIAYEGHKARQQAKTNEKIKKLMAKCSHILK